MDTRELEKLLLRIDGQGYGKYKQLKGKIIEYKGYTGKLTKVQGDPHAPPSIIEVNIPKPTHGLDYPLHKPRFYKPISDFATRILYSKTRKYTSKCGLGNSCTTTLPKPSPRMLYRSSATFGRDSLVLRFSIGLPAEGRRVNGVKAYKLLARTVPRIVNETLEALSEGETVWNHIKWYMLQEEVRDYLSENGYSFIIGAGAVLPRRTGFSQEPLENAVPFKPPPQLEKEVCVEHGCIRGMLVEDGVNIITGGAYHGKTTLLQAVQEGVYNHIPGDGRETVVSTPDTILVQAEDGRSVSCVDISILFQDLPDGRSSRCFKTMNASGSTSMASSISEALELGSKHILFDEDTSATNLLYKDEVMKKLIPEDPIKPLNENIRPLHEKHHISFTAITTASSTFLPHATLILKMKHYTPTKIENPNPESPTSRVDGTHSLPRERVFLGVQGFRRVKYSKGKVLVEYEKRGVLEYPVGKNPRIIEESQVKFIVAAVRRAVKSWEGARMRDIAGLVGDNLEKRGFEYYADPVPPDLAEASGMDVVWVLNRLYGLNVKQA